MKNKVRQMFKDKLFLVMLVLGLLTIVAAAGVVTIQRGGGLEEENPYLSMEDEKGPAAGLEGEAGQLAGASELEDDPSQDGAVQEENALADAGPEADSSQENGSFADAEPEAGEGEDWEYDTAQAGAGKDAAAPMVLNFADTDTLGWPVRGAVLIDYSMDTTTYFEKNN